MTEDETAELLEGFDHETNMLERHMAVLQRILEENRVGIEELSEELGYPHHEIRYSLRILEEDQLVEPSEDGAKATDGASEMVREYNDRIDAVIETLGSLAGLSGGADENTTAEAAGDETPGPANDETVEEASDESGPKVQVEKDETTGAEATTSEARPTLDEESDSGDVGDHDPREYVPSRTPDAPDVSIEYGDVSEEEPIGAGGNADVYRRQVDTPDGPRSVALKTPRFNGTLHTETLERFVSEAKTWRKLDDHANVVGVVDWGETPVPWIAMEYMDGGSLDERIGDVDVPEALWLAGRVAEGLRYGHRHGIAHLDVKPSNVLLRDTGAETWAYPKVSDWGLSRLLLEHSGSVSGLSPSFAAPEQFDAEEFGQPNDLTDIYQFGALCYALLTGEPPFTGSSTSVMRKTVSQDPEPPSARNPDVPSTLDDVVLKALATRKEERYQGLLPMRKDIDQLFEAVVTDR